MAAPAPAVTILPRDAARRLFNRAYVCCLMYSPDENDTLCLTTATRNLEAQWYKINFPEGDEKIKDVSMKEPYKRAQDGYPWRPALAVVFPGTSQGNAKAKEMARPRTKEGTGGREMQPRPVLTGYKTRKAEPKGEDFVRKKDRKYPEDTWEGWDPAQVAYQLVKDAERLGGAELLWFDVALKDELRGTPGDPDQSGLTQFLCPVGNVLEITHWWAPGTTAPTPKRWACGVCNRQAYHTQVEIATHYTKCSEGDKKLKFRCPMPECAENVMPHDRRPVNDWKRRPKRKREAPRPNGFPSIAQLAKHMSAEHQDAPALSCAAGDFQGNEWQPFLQHLFDARHDHKVTNASRFAVVGVAISEQPLQQALDTAGISYFHRLLVMARVGSVIVENNPESSPFVEVDFFVPQSDRKALFCVQVDEYQHTHNSVGLECQRMADMTTVLQAAYPGYQTVWVRFNPHAYLRDGLFTDPPAATRHQQIIELLRTYQPLMPGDEGFEIVIMYYDSWTDAGGRPEAAMASGLQARAYPPAFATLVTTSIA